MRKVVLLDVDGVVADLVSPTVQHLNDLIDPKAATFTVDDVTEWDIAKALATGEFADYYHRFDEMVQWILDSQCFVACLPLYDGAIKCVERMAAVADVYFVTAGRPQSKYWHYERLLWAERHFGGLYKDVIFAQHKHLVHGDFFLDDKASNIRGWRKNGSGRLLKRPWNREETDVLTMQSLEEFAVLVEDCQ